jgi:hypothetical protein
MAEEKTTSSGIPLGRPKAQTPNTQQPLTTSSLAQRHNLPPVAPSNTDPLVWLSENEAPQPLSQVKNSYAFLSPKAYKKFTSQLNKFFPYGWDPSYIEGKWGEASELAAQATAQGKKIAPLDIFDNMLKNSAQAALDSRGGGGGGGGGAAAPTKTINLTDSGTAETLVNQALQGYLGRMASDKEIMQFKKALTKAEMKAPSEVNVSGDTAIRSGGFNPSTFAQQYAEGVEGAAEYQAATTFLDSFIGALGPRVDV